ncbi:MAG: formate-dependent phosphoribosylglycinamide formyltransferase [Pseudomonadota bacterium]
MKIGTPKSPGATRVMLLGSGELGKEVVISLQRYGVEVIAVDRYANAPAQQVAHRAHVIDMTNGQQLIDLISREKPHFIVPEIEAIATSVLAEVEASGSAVVIPNARAVQLTMNREGIRRLAAETLALPTSDYRFVDTLDDLRAASSAVGFPCFVKPIMSSSGKGQSMLKGPSDVEAAWSYAQEGGRVQGTRVIVEGRIDFDFEITLITVRSIDAGGQVQIAYCEPVGHLQRQGDYVESWQPQPMTEVAWAEARRIAHAVVENLGGAGVFGVELFVKGDQVWFSEVSPRPHDTGMVTMITQRQSEFELHARAILGLPVATELASPGASAVIYGGVDAPAVSFSGLEQVLADPDVEVRLFGKPESFSRRRMGVALAKASDTETARHLARDAASRIYVSAD